MKDVLVGGGARAVLDLGCGSGTLIQALVEESAITRIVGIDTCMAALAEAESRLGSREAIAAGRLALVHGCFTQVRTGLGDFDAAAMVETIEHVDPRRLSAVEHAVFRKCAPPLVVVTTPNREHNVRYGLRSDELRHSDHHFEWCRARFRRWASGVAERNGYELETREVGPRDPFVGSPSQMAIFRAVS